MSASVLQAPVSPVGDVVAELRGLDLQALRTSSAYRRAVTRTNPRLFSLVYLYDHYKVVETNNKVSFSEFHLDLFEQAKQWMRPSSEPMADRDCYVAPRGAGKSTLCFLMLPMWAAAHGHVKYIMAFSHIAEISQSHLSTFKQELDSNELLRLDFPELCTPKRRPNGQQVSDTKSLIVSESGFVFEARGIGTGILGSKRSKLRPDLLLLDDIEPKENYSLKQKAERLETMVESVFQLNIYARVVIVGTVTIHGSIIHDLVRTVTEAEPPEQWPLDEKVRVHYYPAIVTDPVTGAERSLWPEKWSMSYLDSRRHVREFMKNMMNQPVSENGDYWSVETFKYGSLDDATRWVLSVDPATTSKVTSDFTGLAVIGYDKTAKKCEVAGAWAVRLSPAALRARVQSILEAFPLIRYVLIETNQGGDTWEEVLSPWPPGVKAVPLHQSESKLLRAELVLSYYENRWVTHSQRLPKAEEQMCAFPNALNDDLVDAIGTGVHFFLQDRKAPARAREEVVSYVG